MEPSSTSRRASVQEHSISAPKMRSWRTTGAASMTRSRAGRRSPRLAWIWLVTAAAMARLPLLGSRVLDQRAAEREAPAPFAALAEDVDRQAEQIAAVRSIPVLAQ